VTTRSAGREIHPAINVVSLWWHVMKGRISAFLLRDQLSGAACLIDSGPPQMSFSATDAALQPFGVGVGDIEFVLHTHGHIDHIGGDVLLKEEGRVLLMIHESDAVFLEDRPRSFDLAYRPGKRNAEEHRRRFLSEVGPDLPVDRRLVDGDRIALGEDVELRVVHLPGHTKGSVGYYWEREGIIVCGDSIPGLGTGGGFLPIIEDFDAYLRSLETVKEMDIETMIVGHRYRGVRLPAAIVRKGREVAEYVADSRDIALRLRDTIERCSAGREGDTVMEIADAVISALPSDLGFRSVRELDFPDWSLGTIAFALGRLDGEPP
jgi:glyoxylase-like metal-dependent hydrolase (beta-lactamase superfamily II)